MTLKKLAAGSGYQYLTRQVAAADSTELGRTKLADYYSAKGEAPGRWIGSGLAGIDGLEYGDVVTAEQMKNLFGEGCDPVDRPGARPGLPTRCRGRVRPDVLAGEVGLGTVGCRATRGRQDHPAGARRGRPRRASFLEQHALFTREGTDGVRQVETRGLIAAAFLHRDSRAGDPDLHTHVAVANKVQTREGKWLSIYGTVLHQYGVAASEAYNTALEAPPRRAPRRPVRRHGRGRRQAPGPGDRGRRPDVLLARWSHRRRDIEDRTGELTADFTAEHGRPPTTKRVARPGAAREPGDPRCQARAAVGGRAAGDLAGRGRPRAGAARPGAHDRDGPEPELATTPAGLRSSGWKRPPAESITELEERRATWQSWHLYAEAQRQVRDLDVPAEQVAQVVEHLVGRGHDQADQPDPRPRPDRRTHVLRRSDGTSVYRHSGADHFTSQRMLDAEQRIVDAAGRDDRRTHRPTRRRARTHEGRARRRRAQRGPARAGAHHGRATPGR